MTVLALGMGLLGAALLPLATPAALGADRHATTACQLASSPPRAGADDLVSLQAFAQEVSSAGAPSMEPAIRRGAATLGRAVQLANLASLQSALQQFQALCQRTANAPAAVKAPSAVNAPSAKSPEVPEAEFDRQLEDVRKRSGAPDASCEKQQFGGGWVAVCR